MFKTGSLILQIQLVECQKHVFFEKGERVNREDVYLGDGKAQRGIIMLLYTKQLSVW